MGKLGLDYIAGATGENFAEEVDFAPDPGNLRFLSFRPLRLPPRPALVVVLHGCGQGAEDYARGAGWVTLAERFGFVLLCPEQRAANNPNRCFNWFLPEDQNRGHGEAASIRAMIDWAVARHGVDPKRIFVTGLSAGGAMAAVMLASYPEIFAGGGIVAGLPYGVADTVQTAFTTMFQPLPRDAALLGGKVRGASAHKGPWPRVSIWQGDADRTVLPANGSELAKQWWHVHDALPRAAVERGGHLHQVWHVDDVPMVELNIIAGLRHGTPLASTGKDALGIPGPFLLEAGISSSLEIARFWGLTEKSPTEKAVTEKPRVVKPVAAVAVVVPPEIAVIPSAPQSRPGLAARLAAHLARALKAAGLTS